jgi:hypothetical protein
VKSNVTFFFDHIPGLASEAIYPFRSATRPPLDGWTRYSVTVEFDDGSMHVESSCIDAPFKQNKDGFVALTTDGNAAYVFDSK